MTAKVTVTGVATPRSDKTTWVVRVDGVTVFGSFHKEEADERAAALKANKRYVATVKWNGGNSRTTVMVEAPNQRVARERAILAARFGAGMPSYVTPVVSFHR